MLLKGLFEYALQYVAFIGIAIAGVMAGKKLRDNKTAKEGK